MGTEVEEPKWVALKESFGGPEMDVEEVRKVAVEPQNHGRGPKKG